jgi:putative transcriptional regulator
VKTLEELKPLTKLIEMREKQNLTQTQLAKKAKVSRPLIANIERGYANPSLQSADRIARALNSTVDEIFFARKARKTNITA